MQDSYNLKLKQPILEPTERSNKAAVIAAGMDVSSETIEKLLVSSGLLLKPQSIGQVNDIAAKFRAAGVDVEVVAHSETATRHHGRSAKHPSRYAGPVRGPPAWRRK